MVRSRVPVVFLSLVLALALLGLAPSGLADPGDDHPDPGRHSSFRFFPKHDEVLKRVADYKDHPWVTVHELGASPEGRAIVMAEVTDPGSAVPMEDRVVTFIFTQQHGNEPAGTPAALRLLDDITAGKPIASTLENQILLLLPMVNPDGAAAESRGNVDGTDINRDHISLETDEARMVHDVLNRWGVHVAMDHHEYGGTGLGEPFPVRLYDYDLTTLYPVHGNVRSPVLDAAMDLMYEGLWPAAEEEGYSANEYGQRTVAGEELDWVAGGPDPGIMRNHLGLHHVAGILVETFVGNDMNPFHDAARRTDIHTVVMEAALSHVSKHAATFQAAKSAALLAGQDDPLTRYVEGEARTGPLAAAYAVPTKANSSALFEAHGLAAGHGRDGEWVHNVASEPYQGHAAAILHPQSLRQMFQAAPTEPFVLPAKEDTAVQESPAAALLALSLLVLVAGALRRRQ